MATQALSQPSCSHHLSLAREPRKSSSSGRPPASILSPRSYFDPLRRAHALTARTQASLRPSTLRTNCIAEPTSTEPSTLLQGVIIPTIPQSPDSYSENASNSAPSSQIGEKRPSQKAAARMQRIKSERATYLVAAIVSSISFTCLAVAAVIYRFASQVQDGGELPYLEIGGTFALAVGAAVGMEFWARWAHKALWHDSLWHMHESHHKPREGPFELNDIFAIINAGPAIGLLAYGFFFPGLVPGLCFGAGLGITMFGMAYMFVHDGMVHRRFPVGPVADVPYLQRVAAAHQLHHADKFEGVPYGLFLGPQELAEVGGSADLEELLVARRAAKEEAKAKA